MKERNNTGVLDDLNLALTDIFTIAGMEPSEAERLAKEYITEIGQTAGDKFLEKAPELERPKLAADLDELHDFPSLISFLYAKYREEDVTVSLFEASKEVISDVMDSMDYLDAEQNKKIMQRIADLVNKTKEEQNG